MSPLAGEDSTDLFGLEVDRLYQRQQPRRQQLWIASWDLTDAAAEGLLLREQKSETVWRHTFGAERRRTQRPTSVADRIDADIAILQGIDNIRETRLLFPASGWNVVFSRSLVNRRSAPAASSAADRLSFAVAHRYIRGLRTTGYEPIRVISEAAFDETGTRRELPARNIGLGIRFSYYGYVFWTASATLPDGCTLDLESDPVTATCREARRLRDWVIEKREDLQPVLTGGRLRASGDPAVAAGDSPAPTATATDQDDPVTRTQVATAPRSNWSDFWSTSTESRGRAPDTTEGAGKQHNADASDPAADCRTQVLNGPTGTHHNARHVEGVGCIASLALNPPQPSNAQRLPRPATNDAR